jgi:hypothetical protein
MPDCSQVTKLRTSQRRPALSKRCSASRFSDIPSSRNVSGALRRVQYSAGNAKGRGFSARW